MLKTFYIKPNERGILYDRSDFHSILMPGTYRRLALTQWRVERHDLSQPEAKIENFESLLRSHQAELEQHLVVVRTAFNEAALVRLGQEWISIAPNQLRAFWRGFIEVEVHRFNLDESLELPDGFVQELRGIAIAGLPKFEISESEIGLLYIQNNFVRPLESGEYAFWNFNRKVVVQTLSRTDPYPQFAQEEILIEQHSEFVATYCQTVELSSNEVAIVRHKNCELHS
jgi:hypothetical protein